MRVSHPVRVAAESSGFLSRMVKTEIGSVEACVFRKPLLKVPGKGLAADSETAICGLLAEICGVDEHPALTVPLAACQACCQSHKPSKTHPNSIVASLLVGLAERIVRENGTPSCSVEKAAKLGAWAEKCLPAVSFDEDDTQDSARKQYGHLAGIVADDIERVLPIPAESTSHPQGHVRNWSVGITTAPRRLPTLQSCAESVIQAGWKDPVLFLDGEVAIPEAFSSLNFCHRTPALGAFPNYFLSLSELYMRRPHADAFMLIQDDAVFVPSDATKHYLERVLWPWDGPCMASLYCSKKYNQSTAGWHLFPESWVWGAVAFVFSNAAVKQILTSPALLAHRSQPGRDGLSKIDVVLGQIAKEQDIPLIFPSPSLVQHIGTTSTIWDHARAVNARYADQFIGDLLPST
ncbi:MAG: hypothetical protein AAGD07_00840 [Planctomycetota bacterium]